MIASIFVAIHYCTALQIDSNLVNKNVERTIDLTSQLVKVQHKITVENKGKSDLSGVSYTFVVPLEQRENLAYISVKDAQKKELKANEEKIADGVVAFTVTIASGNVLNVETVFAKSLQPYPTQITQSERQYVRYFGNAYFYSPYTTLKQKTTVQLTTKSVETFTSVKPSSQADSVITYGPYENITRELKISILLRQIKMFRLNIYLFFGFVFLLIAYTTEDIVVHYENQTPFMTVTNLERVIELSHWGNIAIEETIDIVHSGAALKGSFSRYDFQKDSRGSQSAVKSYKTILPASANGVYYR